MIRLWDMLEATCFSENFEIFQGNAYNENIILFKGSCEDARKDEDLFSYLMDKVDLYYVSQKRGSIVVILKNDAYEKRASELYSESSSAKWDRKDPKTRPWRTLLEIDEGV